MAKRGRKPKAKASFEANVNIAREVAGVVFVILGLVSILSMFNAGGKVGQALKTFGFDTFGLVGTIIPILMIVFGFILLSPQYLSEHKKQVVSGFVGVLILSALCGNVGGRVGEGMLNLVQSGFGVVGSYLFLIALMFLVIIIGFGIPARTLWEKLNFFNRGDKLPRNVRVVEQGGNNERVSVFTTVKRKIGWGRRAAPSQNQIPLPVGAEFAGRPWEPPSIELLSNLTSKPTSGNIAKNVEIIRKKLGDFNIDVTMGDVNVGPTVTQYQLKPTEGVKLNQITSRSDDLALALAAHPIRVEAPIPGKAAVGVEVPNKVTARVMLRQIIENEKFKKRESNLTLALGLDVAGQPITVDLKKLPHLLIAGATGSGKSVCIHAIITTFIYENSPKDLRFILVDPKRVEFTAYNGIPHLLTPVIVDVDKTINILKWAIAEMERRFRVFQEMGARDLESYNQGAKKASAPSTSDGIKHEPMPNIVIVIDELSDLMSQAANEVEGAIVRLAQMARATGIHLIIATQRPSVNVITGLIKANVPARIAFMVASQVDSRTIIDVSGAEKLLGSGDMLYLGGETTKPKRIQGVFLSDKEMKDVTGFLKRGGQALYDQTIVEFKPKGSHAGGDGGQAEDSMYDEAKEVVVRAGKASASLLQRRLKVGYARAARLLDILEANGVIGPPDGAKPREVYLDSIEVENREEPKPDLSTSAYGQVQYESYSTGNQPASVGQKPEAPSGESAWPSSVPPPSAPPPKVDEETENRHEAGHEEVSSDTENDTSHHEPVEEALSTAENKEHHEVTEAASPNAKNDEHSNEHKEPEEKIFKETHKIE